MVTVYPSTIDAPPEGRRGSDFAGLVRQVKAEGLLDRRYGSYALRISVTLVAFAAAWVVFGVLGNSWYQLVVAAALGLLSTQLAFIGHDGGHQQITATKRGNDLIGIVIGDLLVGLSFGWWLDKHNRHHANPNHEVHDPDIGESVIAFTEAHVADRTGRLPRWVAGHQAWLFFPLLTFEGYQLHVAGVRALIANRGRRFWRAEVVLLGAHLVLYFGAVFTVLSPLHAIAFVAVHQAVFGVYMGCSFAPNHKGMAIIADGEKVDFLRRQVLTSRNIEGGRFTDVLLGGLNYQVEHHLFPNMPRPSLPRAQELVRSYCAEHEIVYTETTLLDSYVVVLRHLHQLGEPLRR